MRAAHFIEDLKGLISPARSVLVTGGGILFAGLLQLGLAVLVAFFLYRDGEAAETKVKRITSRVGGAAAFGFVGIFLGPTLLLVGYRMVNEWVDGEVRDEGEAEKP